MSDEIRPSLQLLSLLNVMTSELTGEWYGLELMRAASLKSGTLYPMLARLERAGWITGAWEDADPRELGRPRRRIYRLTGEGYVNAASLVREHSRQFAAVPRRRPSLGEPQGDTP